ncbi:BatA domain-containing protein [Rufibacter psychrotolerans]|uniref:BatA domain-containing protein n=1 Tax=Rufibacter psychrotolerans TaxID=2812556 RepID=UPI0019675198|nr:BatA domain-containing protein [Rufibacter sp. SYSU D00308]
MLPLLSGTAIAATLLLIIHFFGLRLRQKLEFSHIQFLKALLSRTQSVRKINNYLLLLLRLVFLASALGAFLLYLFHTNTRTSTPTGRQAIVLDTSWSMQSASVEKGRSKLELATIDHADLQASFAVSKTGEVGTASREQHQGLPVLAFSSENLLENIRNQSRTSRTYILSDFQRSAFPVTLLQSMPKNQAISLVSYANGKAPNLFIDSVWLGQPILLPNALADVAVRVAGSGLEENTQAKISASEGGKLLGATQVLVAPAEKAVTRFKIALQAGVAKQITFSVEDTNTPFDNEYYIVLPEPASVSIRVGGSMGANHPITQAYKAEPAFTLSAGTEGNAQLWITDIPKGNSASLLGNLKAWLARGGAVMLLPTAGADQSTIAFLHALGFQGVSQENAEVGAKQLRQPDLSDAFFRQIFEKEVKNMKMPAASPVLRWQSAYHTILKFTDNTPFLSTFRIGGGKVHLFASPLNASAPFVAHPLFVPVLYQLALTSNSTKIVLAHQPQNGVIQVPFTPTGAGQQPLALASKGQTFIPDQKVVQDQLVLTLPENVSAPGFYNLSQGGKTLASLALNIPRAESRLEGYTVDELKEILKEHGERVQVLEPQERVSLQKQLQKEATGTSLWKYCLILCFLCLVAEAVILSTKKSGSPS